MEKNIGTVDKTIRIVAAVILAGLGYVYDIWWLYIIGLILLITAIVGFCGLYPILKINTAKKQ